MRFVSRKKLKQKITDQDWIIQTTQAELEAVKRDNEAWRSRVASLEAGIFSRCEDAVLSHEEMKVLLKKQIRLLSVYIDHCHSGNVSDQTKALCDVLRLVLELERYEASIQGQ